MMSETEHQTVLLSIRTRMARNVKNVKILTFLDIS